jgi:hypothetical protein
MNKENTSGVYVLPDLDIIFDRVFFILDNNGRIIGEYPDEFVRMGETFKGE